MYDDPESRHICARKRARGGIAGRQQGGETDRITQAIWGPEGTIATRLSAP